MSGASNLVDDTAESLYQLEGFGQWRVVSAERWAASEHTRARAYIEVSQPGGASSFIRLVADREPVEHALPVFDDGAAADRAHDAAVDRANGVTP